MTIKLTMSSEDKDKTATQYAVAMGAKLTKRHRLNGVHAWRRRELQKT